MTAINIEDHQWHQCHTTMSPTGARDGARIGGGQCGCKGDTWGAKRLCRGRRRRGRHRAVRRRQRVDRGQRAGWRMAGADRGWGGRDRRGVRAAVA